MWKSCNTLREYQLEDAIKLARLNSAACFNQQRTGKTPTALYALHLKAVNRYLVICPASMVYPWATEIKKWTGLDALICSGTIKHKQKQVTLWDTTHPLIVSYDSFKSTKVSEGLVDLIFKQIKHTNNNAIVLDEAHRIRKRTNKQAQAIFKVRFAFDYKLALTVTPAPSHTHDVWAILHFLYPYTFASYWSFIEQYYTISDVYIGMNKTKKEIDHFKSKACELKLQELLNLI